MTVVKLKPVEALNAVPFMDLAALHAPIQREIERNISQLVSNSSFVLGPAVERFEAAFSDYSGCKYAIGCNSGTSAIHMALCALDIGPGDEVITVSHTFVGTAWGILYCGATPVFADIHPDTMNMDVAQLEQLLTSKTRAIVPVHLYGQPVDMDPLLAFARKHGLYVIEDAAQAHGARYKGQRVGSLGDIACFSFYPGKNLGAWGEAGAVVTTNPDFAQRLRRIRDHGQPQRYQHSELGFNYRMDAIQAAVLDVKLRHLDEWNSRRQVLADAYAENLSATGIQLPLCADYADHVYHLYVIRHHQRDILSECLAKTGVSTGLHYPVPVHRQPVMQGYIQSKCKLPVTDQVASECLSLPLHPCLSDEQQLQVCERLIKALETL
jgi:dTDP-4-amino-4,6-dideoxygalactose transaminase